MASYASGQGLLRVMRRCSLFVSLPPTGLRTLLAEAQERHIMRREAVFRPGDRPDGIYLLTRGRMKILLGDSGGRSFTVAFVEPGEAFGYLDVMAGTAHTHAAQATVESSVLAWDVPVLQSLLRRYPATTKNALRLTARQAQDSWNRLYTLATKPVARRLARVILRLARPRGKGKAPIVSIMQQDLAEFLGTTPPTLSRILGKWEARGFVSAGRERIVILRPEELVHIAG